MADIFKKMKYILDAFLIKLKLKKGASDIEFFVQTSAVTAYNKVVYNLNEDGIRINTLVKLRWLAIFGQLSTILFVKFLFDFNLPLLITLTIVAVSAFTNILLNLYKTHYHILDIRKIFLVCSFDLIQLSLLIYFTGGIHNPFIFLIIAPLLISASVLPFKYLIAQGVLAIFATSLLTNYHYPLPWFEGIVFSQGPIYILGIWSSLIICLLFIGFYAWRIAHESNQMSKALLSLEMMQSELIQLKALDGLAAAMGHELGSPLSTIAIIVKEMHNNLKNNQHKSFNLEDFKNDIEILQSQSERCRKILEKLSIISDKKTTHNPLNYITIDFIINEAIKLVPDLNKKIEIIKEPITESTKSNNNDQPITSPKLPNNPSIIYALSNFINNSNFFAKEHIKIIANWDKEFLYLTISDDGMGFSPQITSNIGEPFKTTRIIDTQMNYNSSNISNTGMGLGIFVSRTILEKLGASIKIGNKKRPEHGAVIELIWSRKILEKDLESYESM